MIIYTRLLFWADGFTLSPSLILIHPDHKDSRSLLPHEQVHQAQMRRVGTLTFWWRYLTRKKHRQAYEVQAYKTQIANGANLIECAYALTRDYRLDITQAQAMQLLQPLKENT